MVTQDYSGTLRVLDFYTLATATIDTGADLILFWDATDGALKRGLPPAGGGGVSDGDKGDVTVSSSGTVWTIDNGAVTLAKMASMATDSFLGRDTAGTGAPEVLSASTARTVLGLGGAALMNVGTTAGTVCAGDDSRLSNNRTADSIEETDGPTNLVVGAILDGQYLRRVGGDVVGEDVTQGDIVYSATPNNTVSVASVSAVEIASRALTIVAGDIVEFELWGTLLNDSGAARTYTPSVTLSIGVNVFTTNLADGLSLTNHATSRTYWRIKGWFTFTSTSLTQLMMESDRSTLSAAGTATSIAASTNRKVWNTSAINFVGSPTLQIRFRSDNATATQQFTVYGVQIRQKAAT